MPAFIDEHRQVYGVEPICRVLTSHGLKMATITSYAARNRAPSARAVRDGELKEHISRVHAASFSVYGDRKVWRQLDLEGIPAARCTIARMMRDLGPPRPVSEPGWCPAPSISERFSCRAFDWCGRHGRRRRRRTLTWPSCLAGR